ncbi:NUDIX hydrolase [bacterium]|nr:NUDIX hydrolase [bacterium]
MTEFNPTFVRIRVTVLLRGADGKFCFVRHHKDGRSYWLLPGGGQNPFEPLEEAASREVQEELNVKVTKFKFIALRESMNVKEKKHIQFPIFEGIDPDFSRIGIGNDTRLEGFDFFNSEEFMNIPIYPTISSDLLKLSQSAQIDLFRTLDWIP